MAEGHVKETNIQLTPVHGGRLEVYVDDQKVYDRMEAGSGDFYPGLRAMLEARKALVSALDSAESVKV